MWLPRINARLDRLESAVKNDETRDTLASIQTEIVALRSTIDLHKSQLDLFNQQSDQMRFAISEGIERVDRAERRIKATVARARKELSRRGYEDPGLDAEADELRNSDGNGSDERGLSTVPDEVEAAAGAAPTPRRLTLAELTNRLRDRGLST